MLTMGYKYLPLLLWLSYSKIYFWDGTFTLVHNILKATEPYSHYETSYIVYYSFPKIPSINHVFFANSVFGKDFAWNAIISMYCFHLDYSIYEIGFFFSYANVATNLDTVAIYQRNNKMKLNWSFSLKKKSFCSAPIPS